MVASQETKKRVKRPWYHDRDPLDWAQGVSAALASLAIIVAVLSYFYDRYAPIDLKIEKPDVLEFRCSTTTFDANRCFSLDRKNDAHLSVSAALRMTAIGPAPQTVTIEKATVEIISPVDEINRTLRAFWTGNLTGGDPKFEQVVAQSIHGGQTYSREIWFTPIPQKACIPGNDPECSPERDDFKAWFRFVADIEKLVERGRKKDVVQRIIARFTFSWRPNDSGVSDKAYNCSVEIGETARRQVYRYDGTEEHRLTVTLPCRSWDTQ